MNSGSGRRHARAQIAFEFLIVYSFVLLVFLTIFVVIAGQRSLTLNQQQYASLQLIAQNVADYINQALYTGSGYNATIPLSGSVGIVPYNLTIASTGVVIAQERIGSQIITAYAFSSARNLFVNGTPSSKSTNSILLTVLPNYTGSFRIQNINGQIIIGAQPVNFANKTVFVKPVQVSTFRVAKFNGQAYMLAQNSNLNGQNAITLSMWLLPDNSMTETFYQEALSSGCATSYITSNPAITVGTWNEYAGGNWNAWSTGASLTPDTWQNVVLTISGNLGAPSGTGTLYINGVQAATGTILPQYYPPDSDMVVIGGADTGCPGQFIGSFVGDIADVVAYNGTLSAGQIQYLYRKGMTASPITAPPTPVTPVSPSVTVNTPIGWWPLAGDALDYSGNGNPGWGNNIIYDTVASLFVTPVTGGGAVIPSEPYANANEPIGYFSSTPNTLFGSYGQYISNLTNATGTSHQYFTANGITGTSNIIITVFNGNQTVAANSLQVWFPLTEGGGNVAHDFSGHYNSIEFNSLPLDGIGGAYPTWAQAYTNVTNFQAGNFPGNWHHLDTSVSEGWVQISQSTAYNQIVTNGSVTAVAWVDYKGSDCTSVGCGTAQMQGVFGNGGTIGPGFQLEAQPGWNYVAPVGYNGCAWFIDTNGVDCPASSSIAYVPKNAWAMEVGEYNSKTGVSNFYVNTTLEGTANLGAGQNIMQGTPTYIGIDANTPLGVDNFNGSITNVQLYSNFLNTSQINYLYVQGPTGTPLQSSGLLGWWPLNGNTVDFSYLHNNGTVYNSMVMQNAQYNYTPSKTVYALRTGPGPNYNSVFSTSSGTGLMPKGATTETVTVWLKPTPYQTYSQYNDYFYNGGTSGNNAIDFGVNAGNFIPNACLLTGCFAPTVGPSVTPNIWDFVGTEVNGNKVSFYVNGKWLNGTFSSGTFSYMPGGYLVIGGAGSAEQYNGLISDVQVYNTLLTPAQLQQMYINGLPPVVHVNVTS